MKLKNIEKPRSLEEVCKSKGFCFRKKGYCILSMNGKKGRDIECNYIGEEYHNNVRSCNVILAENNSNYLN